MPLHAPPAVPATASAPAAVSVQVGRPLRAPAIPASFLGVSLEYYELGATLGSDAGHLNPVIDALVANLSHLPSIRIGGESADWAAVPTPGVRPPRPVNETITPAIERVLAGTATAVNARYLLDLDLAADSPRLLGAEGRSLAGAIPHRYIRAFEIGNEPDLYPAIPWSRPPQPTVYARGRGYRLSDYTAEFGRMARVLPGLATAGPASGSLDWATGFAAHATAADRLGLVTVHQYALPECGLTALDPGYPTVAALLDPATAQIPAAAVAPVVRAAGARHLPVRVDEISDAPCFGVRGVSDTFAAALWSLRSAYALAAAGVGGINFHTEPAAAHRLFNFWQAGGVWHGSVFPIYDGLLFFAYGAPSGAHLLATTDSSAALTADASTRGRVTRVTLVNTGPRATVTLTGPAAATSATAVTMTAPAPTATGPVLIGGTSFATGTTTGHLAARPAAQPLPGLQGGRVTVPVPADAAVLVTLSAG